MEHLTRNTNNDRIVDTIKSIKRESADSINKELKDLADKIVTVFSGILSSLISSTIALIFIENKDIEVGIVFVLLFFLIFFVLIWFICIKYAIPHLSRLLHREKVSLSPKGEIASIKQFNYDIIQKIAEVDEIVDVIQHTNISECKMLNLVISLYKLQEVVDFLDEKFIKEGTAIRKSNEDGATALLRYSYNSYTISAVKKTVLHVQEKMCQILSEDEIIKALDGYELLKKDFKEISKKIMEITKI